MLQKSVKNIIKPLLLILMKKEQAFKGGRRGGKYFLKPEIKMEIQITDRALSKIKDAATKEGVALDSTFLRIAVVSGGCSGLTYDLGWETTQKPDDELASIQGLNVVMDMKAMLYMEGSSLDFTDGLEGKGFHFQNPQATRNCACGESFSV